MNNVIHPLVAEDRKQFIESAAEKGADLVVVDVPLLFETGGNEKVDATVVVTVPPEIQRKRVLDRPGMTEEHYKRILSNQMPDKKKRELADFVIYTTTIESARSAVQKIVETVRERMIGNA